MQDYEVVKPMEDPATRKVVKNGGTIALTAAQAKYPLKQGKIKLPAAKKTKTPAKED